MSDSVQHVEVNVNMTNQHVGFIPIPTGKVAHVSMILQKQMGIIIYTCTDVIITVGL